MESVTGEGLRKTCEASSDIHVSDVDSPEHSGLMSHVTYQSKRLDCIERIFFTLAKQAYGFVRPSPAKVNSGQRAASPHTCAKCLADLRLQSVKTYDDCTGYVSMMHKAPIRAHMSPAH